MAKSKIVELTDAVGSGIILSCETGFTYVNQAGGTACLQLEHEGIYVPLGNSVGENDHVLQSISVRLARYFLGPPWKGSGALSGLTVADADVVDDVLASMSPTFAGVRVDRSRLADSREAWIYVTINHAELSSSLATLAGYVRGFEPLPKSGVLVWENSD